MNESWSSVEFLPFLSSSRAGRVKTCVKSDLQADAFQRKTNEVTFSSVVTCSCRFAAGPDIKDLPSPLVGTSSRMNQPPLTNKS